MGEVVAIFVQNPNFLGWDWKRKDALLGLPTVYLQSIFYQLTSKCDISNALFIEYLLIMAIIECKCNVYQAIISASYCDLTAFIGHYNPPKFGKCDLLDAER